MTSIRLTMAQALVRYLAAQQTMVDGQPAALFAGVWAIFGHGNVAALGEALHGARQALPTFRGHNEQAMAHAAIGFAKACKRRRMMACTTSIGPGATNMVTAAALAHVNRLPVLLLPGDVFASRAPDPVLQQVEDFGDATVSANDCFRPVSRYFDRITRPEQIIAALPRAMAVLTDPAECGPAVLALCQDTQAQAYDYPEVFFAPQMWHQRRPPPDAHELARAAKALSKARAPVLIAGGGVIYSGAEAELLTFAQTHQIPIVETQSGKGALTNDEPLNLGGLGVTGTSAANLAVAMADVIVAVGTRLQDFTTGSRALLGNDDTALIGLNIQPFDAAKLKAKPLVADARTGLAALSGAIGDYRAPREWGDAVQSARDEWRISAKTVTAPTNTARPTDAQVIGAVQASLGKTDIVVGAAGGLPGELHKLWNTTAPGGYHMEYGYSCMGYEIAGGIGVKMANPSREVVVMLGDGSYLMANSEIATSVSLNLKLIIVLLDNRGFGCINRLQGATGGAPFNNLLDDAASHVDFAAHAASLGAISTHAASLNELEAAMAGAAKADRTSVIVIDTDPNASTQDGGTWWDVAVPEVSTRPQVTKARAAYEAAIIARQRGENDV